MARGPHPRDERAEAREDLRHVLGHDVDGHGVPGADGVLDVLDPCALRSPVELLAHDAQLPLRDAAGSSATTAVARCSRIGPRSGSSRGPKARTGSMSTRNWEAEEAALERKLSLDQMRIQAVTEVLAATGATRVLDLGCGEGKLLKALLKQRQFAEIAGLDVSHRVLGIAEDRLQLDRMPETQRARLKLLHGSLMYRDARLDGYDAAAVVEVVEHLDPPRLQAFERVLFEFARPGAVVVTTPNVEYNVRFETLPAGKLRHRDHRFEWTRAEFAAWANGIAGRFGYTVRHAPIGPIDERLGSPTQMAVFSR
jgi:3' terminal RNA ribose 2'-O-methyltransferase Hen1